MAKPIETIYKGYRFRSRLEARWAVFFTVLGLEWEYEKEGYDLDGLWYLPDFWIPSWQSWVEIKPERPSEKEALKCSRLYQATAKRCFIIWGSPYAYIPNNSLEDIIVEYRMVLAYPNGFRYPQDPGDQSHKNIYDEIEVFVECPECGQINYEHFYSNQCHGGIGLGCQCGIEEGTIYGKPLTEVPTARLIAAYTAARQARFEHGDTP